MSDTKASPGPADTEDNTGFYYVLTRIRRANGEFQVSVVDGKLVAAAPTMASMLLELEWAGSEAISRCPVCEQQPSRRGTVPGEAIPGMPGYVRWTGETKEIPGGHAPDCGLAAILSELRRG